MKRVLSVLFALMFLLSSMTCIGYAKSEKSDIPWIFIHGMNGYGENCEKYADTPNWGGTPEKDLMKNLRSKGYEVYAPSVGPMSSCWDRACELFAQLTGTVVDYGEAHSKKYGHNRYGRDYSGEATMGTPWDVESKINIVAHSLGGPTLRVFVSLLAYGDADEIAVSGDEISPLFEGGHEASINAAVTLAAPHNGTPLADAGMKTGLVKPLAVVVALFAKKQVNGFYMLEHWNVYDKNGFPSIKNALKFASDDNGLVDITLKGAAAITEKYKLPESVLYLSYYASMTKQGIFGHQIGTKAEGVYTLTAELVSISADLHYDGVAPGKEWEENDGLVPVISAKYPFNDKMDHIDYSEGDRLARGIWNVMPGLSGTHSRFTGYFNVDDAYYRFYEDMFELVKAQG